MKILIITTTFDSGRNGPTRFVNCIVDNIKKSHDITIHILSEDIVCTSDGFHRLKLGKIGRLFRPIGMIYRNWPYYKKAKKLLDIHKYDLIWHNNAIHGVLAGFFLKVPQIGMINDSLSSSSKIEKMKFSHDFFRHYIFSFFEKKATKVFSKVVVNSRYLKQSLVGNYLADISKIEILYKSVNINNTKNIRTRSFGHNGIYRVLFVKSNYKIGDLKRLILALNLLDLNIELLIVGPNVTKKNEILNNIEINNKVILKWMGALCNNQVLELHLDCDIFCTPSVSEALGVANMEAVLMGTPVVYHAVGGVDEIMQFGRHGFRDSEGTVNSLSNAIRQCIEKKTDRELKTKLGREYLVSISQMR